MSRTFRRDIDEYDDYICDDDNQGKGTLQVSKKLSTRDGKPGHKSPSWFKKLESRKRRARRKASLQNNTEQPVEKQSDDWNWA